MHAGTRRLTRRGQSSSEEPRVLSVPGSTTAAEMLAAARRGDLRAWSAIIRQHQEMVFRSAYLTARDSTVAEQATTDAFLRAYRSLGALGDDADIRPWLLRLTDTVARSRQRELVRRRDAREPEAEPIRRIGATPVRPVHGTPPPNPFEQGVLADAFDALDDQDRAVLAARYVFELGRDAAASRLGLEPDAVEPLLANALGRLRQRTGDAMMRALAPDASQRTRGAPAPPGRVTSLGDDRLGSMALLAVFSGLTWTPDVEPLVRDRLEREALAYPVLTVVPDATRGPARPTAADATESTSSRRSGTSVLRVAGLLVGVMVVLVAVGLSVRWDGDVDVEGTDVPAGVTALLGEAVPPPAARPAEVVTPRQAPTRPVRETAAPQAERSLSRETRPWTPELSVVGVRRQGDGSLNAVVRVAWPDGLDTASLRRARLERQVGGARWTPQRWSDAGSSLLAVVKPDKPYRFRVRIADAEGREMISAESGVKLLVRGPRSEQLTRSAGDWGAQRGPYGNRRLVAIEPGAEVRTEFNGTNVALIGGAPGGTVGVRVDDGPWRDDPAADGPLGRSVLFSEDLARGRHSLDVRALTDGLAVDAILILHAPSA